MQSRPHEHCRQSCIGPPAPKNGAIRMTPRWITSRAKNGLVMMRRLTLNIHVVFG